MMRKGASAPVISVIVPVYNQARFAEACLDSILSQTFTRWEAILVDDGSTDASPAICDRYAAADSRFRVIHKANGGLSDARNVGMDMARGEWIAFLDSDDLFLPAALQDLFAAAAPGIDVVCGAHRRFADGASLPRRPKRSLSLSRLSPEEAVGRILHQRGIDGSAWGKLWRRSLVDGFRFRKGICYEDLDFFYRPMLRAEGIALIDAVVVLYRQQHESITHVFGPSRLDVLDVTRRISEYMERCAPRLSRAAHDRELSAAFNMLLLMKRHRVHWPDARRHCLSVIRRYRSEVYPDPDARPKNRLASLLFPLLPL